MRKYFFVAALFLLAIIVIQFSACNNTTTDVKADTPANDSISKVLARGSYLFHHVAACVDCHSSRDTSKYSWPVTPGTEGRGGFVFDHKFQLPGTLYGKNITSDTATGIGSWSDDEILRALTQGISKNGDTLFPLMPYPNYNRMAKEDLMSIIAYVRTLKPISNKVPPRQLMMPISMVYPGKFLQPSVDGNKIPDSSDRIKYGEYITTMADCGTCHSPLTQHGPDMSRMFAGGYPFDLGSNIVVSANITPDSATGIGMWSEAMFVDKFTRYRDPRSFDVDSAHNTIMPLSVFQGMTDNDLKAIYAYLRSVKPINNKVEKFPARK
ncbi:MAG TPA: cytochrome C [Chitinophagaceae bacterium]